MYFSVGRDNFPMAQPSREGKFVASDLATRGDWNGTRARTDYNKTRAPLTCDGNFAETESQISYSRQIVASGGPR